MKEITMVTTCEITTIFKVEDDTHPVQGTDLANLIKKYLGADDVTVLQNQIFIRDEPEEVVGTPKRFKVGNWFKGRFKVK